MKEASLAGRIAMAGACIVCCLLPMLVVLGAISVAGPVFGATAVVVAGVLAVGAWAGWRHRRRVAGRRDEAARSL